MRAGLPSSLYTAIFNIIYYKTCGMKQLNKATNLQDFLRDFTFRKNACEHFSNNDSHDQSYFLTSCFESILIWFQDFLFMQTLYLIQLIYYANILFGAYSDKSVFDDFLSWLIFLLNILLIRLLSQFSADKQSSSRTDSQ